MPKLPSFLAPEIILDHTNDGIYVADPECRILYWNRAAERITGWSSDEVVGLKCSENILMHVDDEGNRLCGPGRCPLHRCMAANLKSTKPTIVYANHKSGHRIPVAVTVAPVRDQSGKAVAGVEVFRDVSRLISDLEQARLVQSSSFSRQLPRGPVDFCVHYQPQELVGGDYYQVSTLPDGRHAFILADVMGHGVAAALYTMTLHAMWQGYAQYHSEPAKFFNVVNGDLARQTLGNSFVTAFMGIIDPVSGDFEYACAGHPPPVLWQPGGKVRVLKPLDLPLAMIETTVYQKKSDHLPPGSMLLVYSDAATEVTDPGGAPLGTQGLMSLVSRIKPGQPDDMLLKLKRRLLAHAQDSTLQDDLCLMLVTRHA